MTKDGDPGLGAVARLSPLSCLTESPVTSSVGREGSAKVTPCLHSFLLLSRTLFGVVSSEWAWVCSDRRRSLCLHDFSYPIHRRHSDAIEKNNEVVSLGRVRGRSFSRSSRASLKTKEGCGSGVSWAKTTPCLQNGCGDFRSKTRLCGTKSFAPSTVFLQTDGTGRLCRPWRSDSSIRGGLLQQFLEFMDGSIVHFWEDTW